MEKIVLFDGDCHFCHASVQFIMQRDPRAVFSFASLQSDIGQQFIYNYHIPKDENSLILIANQKAYSKSTAALKICQQLTGISKFLYIFILIPKPFRDIIYQFIAKNRYKLCKQKACSIPSPETKKRFLS